MRASFGALSEPFHIDWNPIFSIKSLVEIGGARRIFAADSFHQGASADSPLFAVCDKLKANNGGVHAGAPSLRGAGAAVMEVIRKGNGDTTREVVGPFG